MRLSGLEIWYWGTTSRAIGKALDEAIVLGSMVDLHDEIATQQRIANDPQGGCSRSFPDDGLECMASRCAAIPILDSDDTA